MDYLFLIGRLLYGGFFLLNGINHITRRTAYAQFAASKNVPLPLAAVLGTAALLVLGGLSVLLGAWPEIGLSLIAAFLVGTTPMMHRFWAASDSRERIVEQVHFLKNIALLGATLMMIVFTAYAAGPWPFRVVR